MYRVTENCKKTCAQVRWNVVVPRVGQSTSLKNILAMGVYWNLMLDTKCDSRHEDELWTMYLTKGEPVCKQNFLLTAYVRVPPKDRLMAHVDIISGRATQIWQRTQQSFKLCYPNITVSEKPITFTFVFELGDTDYMDKTSIIRESKFVQTSPYIDDRHCLRNLSRDLIQLKHKDSSPDVQLRCGDCIFPAHRLILGARSEVFRNMLQSDMKEGREGSVEIVDMEPKIFKMFIGYLYSGVLPELTENIAFALYEVSDKYDVPSLGRRCGAYLADNLTRKNACEILAMVDAHGDKDLKDCVTSYILNEKIPNDDDEWMKFCKDHSNLAIDVLNQAYKQFNRFS